MKRFSVVLVGLISMVMVVSCNNAVTSGGGSEQEEILAKVVIPLPDASSARAIGLGDAKTHTDFFEISFTNKVSNDVFTASAGIEQGKIETTIPPGTYDILLFAGIEDGKKLLASSYAQDVVILLEETNTVNLTLAIFALDVIVPSKVVVSEDFMLSINVNTNNPLINLKKGYEPRIDYLPHTAYEASVDVDYVYQGGNAYTYFSSFSAPPNPDTGNIWILHGNLEISPSSQWVYTFDLFNPLNSGWITKIITFVEGANVDINISWPE